MQGYFGYCKRLAAILLLVVLLVGPVWGQDSGVRDTVSLSGGDFVVGQSRPLSVRLANDAMVIGIAIPLELKSGASGGFAVYDSVVYRNRLGDPGVLEFRIVNTLKTDGHSPDSIQIACLKHLSNPLPAGDDILMDLYFTGIEAGSMAIDTCTIQVELDLLGPDGDSYFPVFEPLSLVVLPPAPEPPIFDSVPEIPPVAAGDPMTFELIASSPGGDPVTVSLESVAHCDDSTILPATGFSLAGVNPLDIQWTPTSADIGIWCAEFAACDSSGLCTRTTVMIQVVSGPEMVVSFSDMTIEVGEDVLELSTGDFIPGGPAELFVSSSGLGSVITDQMYVIGDDGIGSEVYSEISTSHSRGTHAGYIDLDDYLDVVIKRADGISVLHGDGGGGFADSMSQISGYLGVRATQLAEFTGDGYLDYIVFVGMTGYVHEGLPDGTFRRNGFWSFSVSDSVISADSEDFDNDGDRDLALGTVSGMRIYLNDGGGQFSPGASYAQTFGTTDIQVTNAGSDFNGDGWYDLSLATPSIGGPSGELVVYLGNGDGTFQPQLVRSIPGQIVATRTGDFNHDTQLDIAFLNAAKNYLGVLLGDGTGAFSDELRFPLHHGAPVVMTVLDCDVDGDLDVVVYGAYLDGNWSSPASLTVLANQTDPASLPIALCVEAVANAEIGLRTAGGFGIDRISSTLSAASFHEKASTQLSTGQRIEVSCLPGGDQEIVVAPRAGIDPSTPFSLRFTLNGMPYRLAEDAVMPVGGVVFPIQVTGPADVLPASGSFTHNPRPTFAWPQSGDYVFELSDDPAFAVITHAAPVSGGSYTLPFSIDVSDTALVYWRVRETTKIVPEAVYVLNIVGASGSRPGDVTGDGQTNLTDISAIITWIFLDGQEPPVSDAADVNSSGRVDLTDITLLVNHLFFGGSLL